MSSFQPFLSSSCHRGLPRPSFAARYKWKIIVLITLAFLFKDNSRPGLVRNVTSFWLWSLGQILAGKLTPPRSRVELGVQYPIFSANVSQISSRNGSTIREKESWSCVFHSSCCAFSSLQLTVVLRYSHGTEAPNEKSCLLAPRGEPEGKCIGSIVVTRRFERKRRKLVPPLFFGFVISRVERGWITKSDCEPESKQHFRCSFFRGDLPHY